MQQKKIRYPEVFNTDNGGLMLTPDLIEWMKQVTDVLNQIVDERNSVKVAQAAIPTQADSNLVSYYP